MNDPIQEDLAEALANCAREPVHAPGAIQPAGCLLCVDNELQRVLQVSANIGEVLGVSPEEAFAFSPAGLLGPSLFEQFRNSLDSGESLPLTLEHRQQEGRQTELLQVTVYQSDLRWVFELEPIVSQPDLRPLTLLNRWIKALARAASREQLLSGLVEAVESLTGYDRIMVYQFDEQWHGTVISETRRDSVESFLGHRFPETDIPAQVRRLYGINPVRSIPDAKATAVSLLGRGDNRAGSREGRREDTGSGPLDMGQGYLRASSPVHLRYLANMGVGASLSVAIHGEDDLWGLLACHHLTPKALSPKLRETILALVQVASERLFLLESRGEMRFIKRVLDSRELVSSSHGRVVRPDELVREHGQDWQALFDACGLALLSRFGVSRLGITPEEAVLAQITSRLNAAGHQHGPWFTDQLSATALVDLKDLDGDFGLLALPMHVESPPGWFLLFRQEQLRTHRWAGKPEDVLVQEEGRKVLSPRLSFASWEEEVRGKSRQWLPIEVQAAQDLAEDLAVAVSINHIEQLNDELQEANRQLESLAHTDSLTGVWNRYHLEASIDAEINTAQRYNRPCCLLLFDIDHFKQFNDQHGHEAGDRVLKKLATTVQACLRAADRFGRWGGEEFLILTGIEPEGAALLAERVRREVAEMDVGDLGRVTVSIGVACYHPGDSRKQLVGRADQAMYQAKNDGRDRVVSSV